MKYLYLELNGFKRFLLNQIDHFAIHITNPLQIILGTNGSGKSSMLQQLTPLPANKIDFSKTGSKIIKIEKDNCLYTLTSTFLNGQKHSFIRGDFTELNEGGTLTVQKELVKSIFGITPEIHSLLLGEEIFTSMAPSRKKEWLLKLCETNYDYAIKVFTSFKEKNRDVVGALKLARKKLVHESEKLIKSEEEDKLKSEVQELHTHLNFLLENRKPVETDIELLKFENTKLDTLLIKYGKLLQDKFEQNGQTLYDESLLQSSILFYSNQAASSKALLEESASKYSENETKIAILQKAESDTIETLTLKLKEKQNKANKLEAKLLFEKSWLDSQAAMNAFLTVKNTLSDIFTSIPENKNKKYSLTELSVVRNTLALQTKQKQNLNSDLLVKEVKLKHMLEHKEKPDLSCPKCNHKFSLHYSENDSLNLTSEINTIQTYLANTVEKEILACEIYIQECAEYSTHYRQYSQIVLNYSVLNSYWDYLNEKKTISDNPKSGINELLVIEKDLKNQILNDSLQLEIAEITKLLSSLMDVGGADLNTLVQVNESLQSNLESHTNALQAAINNKTKQQAILIRNKEINTLISEIQKYADEKYSLCKEEIETTRRRIYNDVVKTTQSHLASKEHILSSFKSQKVLVNNLYLQIEELESEEIALSLLVKQLSPFDGLIAEGLFGFIREFVRQMNFFIKRVWTYLLEVKPCELEEGESIEIDYIFKLIAGNKENEVPDVSKGSTAMREIVNLSFRVTAMKYLGLLATPFYLDEFAQSFDETHRVAATGIIKTLIEQQIFSQIFVVSHYASSYEALSNADICILNNLNITVPKTNRLTNAHVTMN
jgi:DNA repair exonuclease SbcCD ATPase subunit